MPETYFFSAVSCAPADLLRVVGDPHGAVLEHVHGVLVGDLLVVDDAGAVGPELAVVAADRGRRVVLDQAGDVRVVALDAVGDALDRHGRREPARRYGSLALTAWPPFDTVTFLLPLDDLCVATTTTTIAAANSTIATVAAIRPHGVCFWLTIDLPGFPGLPGLRAGGRRGRLRPALAAPAVAAGRRPARAARRAARPPRSRCAGPGPPRASPAAFARAEPDAGARVRLPGGRSCRPEVTCAGPWICFLMACGGRGHRSDGPV